MSEFFIIKGLEPYTPGEQPKNTEFVKLNTNESPFPPSPLAVKYASLASERLHLYSDPDASELTKAVAENLGVDKSQVLMTNGSDEILNFAFMAFCHKDTGAVFPDITYGFYKVFAEINGVPYTQIPLQEDFSINPKNYYNIGKTIFIANPNAPTGIFLEKEEIEEIIKSNPENVVVVDEAYVDFGGESCVSLINKYPNLLVTRTFSKSRSMAGARLGFGVGNSELIADLNSIKFSTNPYNVNSMTMSAGLGCMKDEDYTLKNCRTIIKTREYVTKELSKLGFYMTDSKANFVFAKHPEVSGEKLYTKLRQRGVLVRHFNSPEIQEYNRITIGTKSQMDILIEKIKEILEEEI